MLLAIGNRPLDTGLWPLPTGHRRYDRYSAFIDT